MKLQFDHKLLVLILVAVLFSFYMRQLNVSPAVAQVGTGLIRVAPTGSNIAGCGSEATPCRTIQFAVNQVASGGSATILVAAGTYTYNAADNVCSKTFGITAVVCIVDKQLALIGGYSTGNWSTPDPANNLTVIDGQNTNRGLFVIRTRPATELSMEGFTIQRGVARGISARSGDDKIFAFGGGMFANNVQAINLRNVIFKDNKAIGESTGSSYGGTGAGGGVAIRGSVSNKTSTTLEHVTFTNNTAQGGTGANRGGLAIGGGLFTNLAIVNGSYITFTNNSALAGRTNGNGAVNGLHADAQGGGGAAQEATTMTLQHVTVTGNAAIGGNAPNGNAGGAFGGGLFAEGVIGVRDTKLTVTDSVIRQNTAQGGNGVNGGLGAGGAIESVHADIVIDRVTIVNNLAKGGNGAASTGSPGGGGVYLTSFSGKSLVTIQNSIIADNNIEFGATGSRLIGGGGGGVWLQGVQADLIHNTIARNSLGSPLGLQGQAILLLNFGASTPTIANISYNIIANHTNNFNIAALHVQPGNNTVNLNRGLWAANSKNDNSNGGPAGTFNGLNTMLSANSAGFISPGSPNYDYHIGNNSAAKDQASGSPVPGDIDTEPRTHGAADIGADENIPILLTVSIGDSAFALTWKTNPKLVPGVDHYLIVYSGPGNPANEGASPINVGSVTAFNLTGLTNYQPYALRIQAYNTNNNLLATSNTVVVGPTDQSLYLPLLLK